MSYHVLVVDHTGRGGSYSRKLQDELALDQFVTELLVDAGWSPDDISEFTYCHDSGAGIEIDNATTLHIVKA